VHIFFTFWGLDIVNKKTNKNLAFTMLGNTAMHMPEFGYLRAGLEHGRCRKGWGNCPA
jgi:peroxiredoxin family protein